MSTSAPSALLLEVLVCPRCRRRPSVDHERAELVCDGCALAYPVRDGVVAMAPDRARPVRPPGR